MAASNAKMLRPVGEGRKPNQVISLLHTVATYVCKQTCVLFLSISVLMYDGRKLKEETECRGTSVNCQYLFFFMLGRALV